MDDAGEKWRGTKNKRSSLHDALFFPLVLTTVEHRAAKFSTRSSDYHCVYFPTVLSTYNMHTYVEFLLLIIILYLQHNNKRVCSQDPVKGLIFIPSCSHCVFIVCQSMELIITAN